MFPPLVRDVGEGLCRMHCPRCRSPLTRIRYARFGVFYACSVRTCRYTCPNRVVRQMKTAHRRSWYARTA